MTTRSDTLFAVIAAVALGIAVFGFVLNSGGEPRGIVAVKSSTPAAPVQN